MPLSIQVAQHARAGPNLCGWAMLSVKTGCQGLGAVMLAVLSLEGGVRGFQLSPAWFPTSTRRFRLS